MNERNVFWATGRPASRQKEPLVQMGSRNVFRKQDFAWQAGYGAFAVSYFNFEDVKRYLVNQAEHHRVRTFQEEFIALLNRHNVEFDEQFLWD